MSESREKRLEVFLWVLGALLAVAITLLSVAIAGNDDMRERVARMEGKQDAMQTSIALLQGDVRDIRVHQEAQPPESSDGKDGGEIRRYEGLSERNRELIDQNTKAHNNLVKRLKERGFLD